MFYFIYCNIHFLFIFAALFCIKQKIRIFVLYCIIPFCSKIEPYPYEYQHNHKTYRLDKQRDTSD